MDYRSCFFASSESESDISSEDQDVDDVSNSISYNFDKKNNENNTRGTSNQIYDVDMDDSNDNDNKFTKSTKKTNDKPSNNNSNTMEMPFNPKAYGKGFNMLAKMGYKGGGLGKDGSGRVQPIIVTSNKGKQVDIVEDSRSIDISSDTSKKLPVKFIDQDESFASERWSGEVDSVSDMSDAINKSENFINNISQGKMIKVECSKTKGSIGTLITTLISQAQHDLVKAMNNKRSEEMEIDRKTKSSSEIRETLSYKNTKLVKLQSLHNSFDMVAALNIEDDGEEIVASYISNSIKKIEVNDIIHSTKLVNDLHILFTNMLYQSETKDMINIDIIKRLYESHIVKPLVQYFKTWNVEQVEKGLDIYTRWDNFKILSKLPIQVITNRIIEWLDSSNSPDLIPPHMIIHPWLPYLNDTEQLYTSLIKLFYRIAQIREDLAVPLVEKWHFLKSDSVNDSFKELIEYIREKFRSKMSSIKITFDMKNFLSLVDCLLKSQLYTDDIIAKDISSLVSKYSKVVKTWINDGEIERVVESYQCWSDTLSPILDHALIKSHFLVILNAMNDSTEDNVSENINYMEQTNIDNQNKIFAKENLHQFVNSNITQSGKSVNLFDYLTKIAMKKGIDLKPKVGRMHDGKQVYSFGKVLIVVERLLIHAMIDKVWKPVNIPQLLRLA